MSEDEVITNSPNADEWISIKNERHIFSKSEIHFPMYHCYPEDGVVLARSSPTDMSVPPILIEKKKYIDEIILPAVGVLYSVYAQASKIYIGTGFVTSKPSTTQHQRVMTAFHNVQPIKYTELLTLQDEYDWPIVYFSTHFDGSYATYGAWINQGKNSDRFHQLEFNRELLLKWQNTPGPFGGNTAPKAAYFTDESEDLIELEVVKPSNYSYLQLAQDPTNVQPEDQVICVGYPGYPETKDAEIYKSTKFYDPNNLPHYIPEFKTVSYGRFHNFMNHLVTHSCSTVSQNSGSPIILLNENTKPANVVAVHVLSGVDDTKSRNYNTAICYNYWINKSTK